MGLTLLGVSDSRVLGVGARMYMEIGKELFNFNI